MHLNLMRIIVLFLMSTAVTAQDCDNTFNGIIKNADDKLPIIEAVIQIEGSEKFVITDSNGNFTIKNLCKKERAYLWSRLLGRYFR